MLDGYKVRMISITEPLIEFEDTDDTLSNTEKLISFVARVSNPSNQNNTSTAEKLLKYCINKKHWSVFEMADVTMEIKCTRDIGRQILRHHSARFQEFCVSGKTLITTAHKSGSFKKVSIENLYKRQNSKQYSDMSDWLVKIYDKESGSFTNAKIKEIFDTGIKPVYELITDSGKKIVCTENHKFFTLDGFKELKDLNTDHFIACNGAPLWQNYEWIKKAKTLSIQTGSGVQGIADLAGCKYITIRKWLKRYNLQFTKKEVSLYTDAWNKGIPSENQPMYGKFHNEITRNKMRNSSRKGKESNFYKNGNVRSWRFKVAQFCKGFHTELLQKQNFKCAISGELINRQNSEVDHIITVYKRPDLAFDKSNLQILSKKSHLIKSQKESQESRKTIRYQKIKSIKFVGMEQTYDMEIDHVDHNYIANGFVTHNSQRYATVNIDDFVIRECRFQDNKNRQSSIEVDPFDKEQLNIAVEWEERQRKLLDHAIEDYQWALSKNIAKEQARVVLPEGNTPSVMYMKMSVRDWFHYCQLRTEMGTQKEHRIIAGQCWDLLCTKFSFLRSIKVETENSKI